jgi:hypothetical protein
MIRKLIPIIAIATAAHSAAAQSFNVDWGSLDSSPSSSYAAEGLAGVWNTFDSMPNFQQQPLVGLDGLPIQATIMNIGFDVIESSNNPATTGDAEALLDDCFTSFNDPIDGCIFLRNIEPGEYRVILYAMAPDDDTLLSRLRIDQNTEDPEHVGGAWTGAHTNGITFMTQTATVAADGRLDFHSGLPSGNIRSVLNGMQVIQLGDECPADIDSNGTIDIFDVLAFIDAYNTEDPAADFTDDGSFDIFDVLAFIEFYNAGCPS